MQYNMEEKYIPDHSKIVAIQIRWSYPLDSLMQNNNKTLNDWGKILSLFVTKGFASWK